MEEYLTVGEISKATKIPISTLRYYDQQGILSPAVKNEATKYRYYLPSQIPILKMIAHLRRLGFSIKYLKSHLKNTDYDHTKELIEKTIEDTKIEIERLKGVEKELLKSLEDFKIEEQLNSKIGVPFLEDVPDFRGRIFLKHEYTLKEVNKSLREGIEPKGIIVKENSWKKDRYAKYGLFAVSLDEKDNETLIIEKGICACIYGKGFYEENKDIDSLFHWIEEQGFETTGEFFIFFPESSFPYKSPKDFIYTVRIPVKKMNVTKK